MKTILVLHDMTVTGVNPSADVSGPNDPEVVRIAYRARKAHSRSILEELRDGLAAK
ncbi:MAG: hypothetical protein KatS3mg038_3840 [Candidatus Kapaibacterium sp.]|nr:MAG: hypothetical protein KatS3mg038_3840 [Candidatus Kapabacteria bacterium]